MRMYFHNKNLWTEFFYFTALAVSAILVFWNLDMLDSAASERNWGKIDKVKTGLRNTVYYILLFFVVSLAVEYSVVRRPESKVRNELVEAINKLSRGETNIEISPETKKRDDEFGELARAFDRTLVSLKISMEEKEK